ncbi:hypothetical protein BJ742DRAFT_865566 [Cladochytrium replicatum]|nr:hypothetical protein BJ742DRAFT_865566 [Cladochytrium replicatum]
MGKRKATSANTGDGYHQGFQHFHQYPAPKSRRIQSGKDTNSTSSANEACRQTLSGGQGVVIPSRLRELEKVIEENIQTGKFFLVGAALREISDEGLYALSEGNSRSKDKTVYAFAQRRFAFSRRTTNTYLCSTSVYESLVEDPTLRIPTSISHIRSLHRFSPESRRRIWKSVCDSNTLITEEKVVAAAAKYASEPRPSPEETPFSFGSVEPENLVEDVINPDDLYAPISIITAAKRVLGQSHFDIDPASSNYANTLHPGRLALRIYGEREDGLVQPWNGNVWVFPPTGDELRWVDAARQRYETNGAGITSCWILLRTRPAVASRIVDAYPHVYLCNSVDDEPLAFGTPTGEEKYLEEMEYVLVYMGPVPDAFCNEFGRMGRIPGYNTWSWSSAQQPELPQPEIPQIELQHHEIQHMELRQPEIQHVDPSELMVSSSSPMLPPLHAAVGTHLPTMYGTPGVPLCFDNGIPTQLDGMMRGGEGVVSGIPDPGPGYGWIATPFGLMRVQIAGTAGGGGQGLIPAPTMLVPGTFGSETMKNGQQDMEAGWIIPGTSRVAIDEPTRNIPPAAEPQIIGYGYGNHHV